MAREKIGTVTEFREKETQGEEFKAEVTIQLSGKIKNNSKVALLGPVAYNPAKVTKIEIKGEETEKAGENDEAKLTISSNEKINVRENTTAYKMT